MKRIIIILPCYNCANQASRLAQKIDFFLSSYKSPLFDFCKVVFIDNKSTDSTVFDLEKKIKTLKNRQIFSIWQNHKNLGLGGTQKVAFQIMLTSNYDYLAVIHGDDQADIQDLKNLLKHSAAKQYSTVLGSRFLNRTKTLNYSKFRILGNRTLNFIYSTLLDTKIYDLGSGLNLFAKKDFLLNFDFLKFDDGFTFNMDLILYLSQKGTPLNFAPIHWKCEDEKSNANAIGVGTRSLLKVLKWTFLKEKIWQTRESLDFYKSNCIYNAD